MPTQVDYSSPATMLFYSIFTTFMSITILFNYSCVAIECFRNMSMIKIKNRLLKQEESGQPGCLMRLPEPNPKMLAHQGCNPEIFVGDF